MVSAQQPQTTPQQSQSDSPPPRDLYVELPRQPENDWPRHFRVGMLVGLNISASFKMGGLFSVSGSQPGAAGVSGVDHVYDDGYVRVDDTGNAQGLTSFWGYNDASQFNAAGQTLTFHSANSFAARGSANNDDSPYIGFDMAYGGELWRKGRMQIGWELGFGLLPIGISDNQAIPAVINRTVHSFQTGGILPPTAPYNGGPSGVGPTIQDKATLLPDDILPGTVTGSRTLDATLYAIRLGPSLQFELNRHWAVSVGAGAAVGIVEGELRFDEMIVSGNGASGRNSGRVGGTDVTFGGYVSALVMYHAVENGDVYIGVQYMPLGSAQISGGGREARLNMSGGVYFSAGINWPF